MWLKTGDFASNPTEDFVLQETDTLQATIPVPILKKLVDLTPGVFSVILYEVLFDKSELILFDKLIDSLEEKGIFVVSLGEHSPNTAFAQEVLEKITSHEEIVTPALMTRFAHTSVPSKTAYAFRFKKKAAIKLEAKQSSEPKSKETKKQKTTKKPETVKSKTTKKKK